MKIHSKVNGLIRNQFANTNTRKRALRRFPQIQCAAHRRSGGVCECIDFCSISFASQWHCFCANGIPFGLRCCRSHTSDNDLHWLRSKRPYDTMGEGGRWKRPGRGGIRNRFRRLCAIKKNRYASEFSLSMTRKWERQKRTAKKRNEINDVCVLTAAAAAAAAMNWRI